MAGSDSKGLLEVLQDGAQSAFSSAAAVWADLTQAASQKQDWGLYSSMDSSSSSRTFVSMLRDTTEEFKAHLWWSTPLLQVCSGAAVRSRSSLSQHRRGLPASDCLSPKHLPALLPAQPNTHVPLPTHWDTRTILAFLDCLRAIQHSFVTQVTAVDGDLDTDDSTGGASSSSNTYLTMPPVTAALAAALLLVFTRPGGVALKDVALSPYCVLVKKEHWRWVCIQLGWQHTKPRGPGLSPYCVRSVCWVGVGCGLVPKTTFDACTKHSTPLLTAPDHQPCLQGSNHNSCMLT